MPSLSLALHSLQRSLPGLLFRPDVSGPVPGQFEQLRHQCHVSLPSRRWYLAIASSLARWTRPTVVPSCRAVPKTAEKPPSVRLFPTASPRPTREPLSAGRSPGYVGRDVGAEAYPDRVVRVSAGPAPINVPHVTAGPPFGVLGEDVTCGATPSCPYPALPNTASGKRRCRIHWIALAPEGDGRYALAVARLLLAEAQARACGEAGQ